MRKLLYLFLLFIHVSAIAGLVIKHDSNITRYASSFGMHFHRIGCEKIEGGDDGGRWPTSFVVPIVRLWDSGVDWRRIEPAANTYDFRCFDHFIRNVQRHESKIIYTFANSPQWASARPYEPCAYGFGCAAEPLHMGDWERYVREVIIRYRGKIDYYEVWNEPMLQEILTDKGKIGFYSGSVKKLIEMTRIVRKVINEQDPNAKLLSPAFTNGADRLDLFLKEGGLQLIDGVAYHFYAGSMYSFFEVFLPVQAVMNKYGISDMPLLNTEWGVGRTPAGVPAKDILKESNESVADFIAQTMVLNLAANFKYSVYYAYDDEVLGLVDTINKRTLPQYKMFEFMREILKDYAIEACNVEKSSAVFCDGLILKEPVRLFWSSVPLKYKVKIPAKYHYAVLSPLSSSEGGGGEVRIRDGDLINSMNKIQILRFKAIK
ncbi:MAG: beta-galactosidase [Proteobacteria bacterium]|nr:beta-galactosidase [Pseudomonadota bacterium]